MKIAIDIQTTKVAERVGMGSYVENLTRQLAKITRHNYLLLAPSGEGDLSSIERFIWDQLRFPIQALQSQVDIIHQPAFSAPILPTYTRLVTQSEQLRRPKVVVTVHDLIIVHFPQNMPLGSRLYFSRWMPFSYRFADAIICDSQATKRDLLAHSSHVIGDARVEVIHLAADEQFRPITHRTTLHRVKQKFQTGDKFILHVGTLEPRKNLAFLIRVFAEVIRLHPLLSHRLVITGKKGWYYEGLFDLVRELQLADRVVFAGYVPDEDLPALYSAADLFVFPSEYEGFGMPPLEAMRSGTPVVVANNSSLPEVVGKSGLLVETNNKLAWIKVISEVLTRPALHQKLVKEGLERAQLFSWQKTAEKTVDLYESLQVS